MATSLKQPSTNNPTSPPPWQVLFLIAHHLDPKTLAIASTVSKSWSTCFSLDHHWNSICSTHYPSLSTLKTTDPTVSYRRLYALCASAASKRRRLQNPPKPNLSLSNLIFTIDIRAHQDAGHIGTIAIFGEELPQNADGLFQFNIPCTFRNLLSKHSVNEVLRNGVKISWNVVLKGWGGVFCMMECEGEGSGDQGWFSEELPPTACCSKEMASGLVADLKLGFGGGDDESGGDGVVRVERVSVGLLSMVSWRYVCVDDGLRYLQHFLCATL